MLHNSHCGPMAAFSLDALTANEAIRAPTLNFKALGLEVGQVLFLGSADLQNMRVGIRCRIQQCTCLKTDFTLVLCKKLLLRRAIIRALNITIFMRWMLAKTDNVWGYFSFIITTFFFEA